MRQHIKADAADCAAGRGGFWDIVFSAVCTLDARHNSGYPRQRPPQSEPPSNTCSSRARAPRCLLSSDSDSGMLRCDLMWSVHINSTAICPCLYIMCCVMCFLRMSKHNSTHSFVFINCKLMSLHRLYQDHVEYHMCIRYTWCRVVLSCQYASSEVLVRRLNSFGNLLCLHLLKLDVSIFETDSATLTVGQLCESKKGARDWTFSLEVSRLWGFSSTTCCTNELF